MQPACESNQRPLTNEVVIELNDPDSQTRGCLGYLSSYCPFCSQTDEPVIYRTSRSNGCGEFTRREKALFHSRTPPPVNTLSHSINPIINSHKFVSLYENAMSSIGAGSIVLAIV